MSAKDEVQPPDPDELIQDEDEHEDADESANPEVVPQDS